jgi:hypothetical protein
MASLAYIDAPGPTQSGHSREHKISKLTHQILDPESPSDGLRMAVHLVHLLLLSDHINQAHSLLHAIWKHQNAIIPPSSSGNSREHYPSLPEQYFWHAHPDLAQPPNFGPIFNGIWARFPSAEAWFAHQQWNEYRECTRTGWMLEHCGLEEPSDPHSTWKTTDDEAMLGMCARLLAKNKTAGEYPSREDMVEALEVAKKLYARPQPPITEWDEEYKGKLTRRRHSYLLYRRLVIEIAIRVDDLQTAAEVLSQALRLDGFNSVDGGALERFLFVPGIYDVLPLLAAQGKQRNPFYIDKDGADAMVKEVTDALQLRAEKGRQWSLAPEKVGWDELLHRLAEGAWKVNRRDYMDNKSLSSATEMLFEPATEEEIAEAEKEVGELPADFKDMVRVANG